VDALAISPTAWTTSHSATAQHPPDEVHEEAKSHLVVAVPKCVGPTRNPTASAESSVSLSVLSLHHDIFSYKIHML
jgi:hypothetical protein